MHVKRKMEIGRNILYNAANMNMSYELILKISQKVDEYVVEYLRNSKYQKNNDMHEGKMG